MLCSAKRLALDLGDGFRRTPPWQLVGLILFVIAGTVLRVSLLTRGIHHDEAWTFLHYARVPIRVGLSTYSAPNNHLFNTLLVHLSTLIFGNAPWALRLPALIVGALLIPATYLLARVLFVDKAAAVLAAGLTAF